MVRPNYEPSEVLISLREPYNKNTVWIHPHPDNIEVKVFDNGWRLLSQTKDVGLSPKSEEQIEKLNSLLKETLIEIIKKQFGKLSSDYLVMNNKYKILEQKVKDLEDRFDKLSKKYSNNGK